MLEGAHLSAGRNGRLLFQDLSFIVRPGQLLHLTGQNGVGKTTLLETLAGILPPARGRVSFKGRPLKSEDFLYIGIQKGFKAILTVRENLTFWSKVYGGAPSSVDQALTLFRLSAFEETLFSDLSNGQKQRLSLARLCLIERPLWLLDEPFLGLDEPNTQKVRALFADKIAAGGSLCVASHTSPLSTSQQTSTASFQLALQPYAGLSSSWDEESFLTHD